LSRAEPYREINHVRSAHAIAQCGMESLSRWTDYKQRSQKNIRKTLPPPGSILSPPPLLWFARVAGFFKIRPPTVPHLIRVVFRQHVHFTIEIKSQGK